MSPRLTVVGWVPLLLAGGLLAGCSGEPSQRGSEAQFKVALLTAGPVTDAGWYAGAYEGLQMVGDSLGAVITHEQTRTPAQFDEAFFAYGSEGYDLVFAHGFEYQDAAMRAGERFPEMTIVVSGGGQVSDNVIPLIFRLEEGSYLAGMVAGGVSQTGVVGMVGGVDIPPARGTFDAFRAGAEAVQPGLRILESYTGDWDDVSAAKEAAVAQLRADADVLIHNTDAGSFGIFQAVREASNLSTPRWALGMNRDQNSVAPDVILGSAVIRIPEAFLRVARDHQDGTLSGQPTFTGIRSGVIDFVPNPELVDQIPAEVLDRVDDARERIRTGALQVPRIHFVEGETEEGASP